MTQFHLYIHFTVKIVQCFFYTIIFPLFYSIVFYFGCLIPLEGILRNSYRLPKLYRFFTSVVMVESGFQLVAEYYYYFLCLLFMACGKFLLCIFSMHLNIFEKCSSNYYESKYVFLKSVF